MLRTSFRRETAELSLCFVIGGTHSRRLVPSRSSRRRMPWRGWCVGGAAGMALNNFADVTKNAETLAGTIIPQLSTLSKFLLDTDAADLNNVGAELKGLNKMFDEKLGFLMKASAKKANTAPGRAIPSPVGWEVLMLL